MTAPAGPSGGLLVLVHGYLDGPTVWDEVRDRLDVPGWEAVAVDLRGVPAPAGASSGATLERYAATVVDAVAERAPSGAVVLVGHSMGGPVAELAAVALAPRLRGLVLVLPAPLGGVALDEATRLGFLRALDDRDAESAAQQRQRLAPGLDAAAAARLGSTALTVEVERAREQLDAWTGGHPAGTTASPVEATTLVVTTDDTFFPPSLLREQVSSRFTAGRTVAVPGAGHWPQVERPDAVAAILTGFVAGLADPVVRYRGDRATVDEVSTWFFSDYLPTWVGAGRGAASPAVVLSYWDVPLHAASFGGTGWLSTADEVLGLLAANQDPLRAAGYDHTVVPDRRIAAYRTDAATVEVIWSRRRPDESEVQRLAVHFEVRRDDRGWRIVSIVSVPTTADDLAAVWPDLRELP